MSTKDDEKDYNEIPASRKANWERFGVEAIEADLKNSNGVTYVGGPPEARQQAWLWVRVQRNMQQRGASDAKALLKQLYRASNSGSKAFHLPTVKIRFDSWNEQRFEMAVRLLVRDEFIELQKSPHVTGYGQLTPTGIDQVEDAIVPKGDVHNTVNVAQAGHVNVQQAGHGAQQTQIHPYSAEEVDELRKFVEFLSDNLTALELDSGAKKQVRAQIAVVDGELDKPEPQRAVVSEALQSVRKIVESAAGGIIARLATDGGSWSWAIKILGMS
jgi:hypothetical protein